METITHVANQIIEQVIKKVYGNLLTDFSKYRATKTAKADYQFGQIGSIAKLLNLKPKDVAETIHNCLFSQDLIEFVETIEHGGKSSSSTCSFGDKVETEKQIFIIFSMKTCYLQDRINNLYSELLDKNLPPPLITNFPSKILVDFSSPNVAKEMHVGHLRSTIIGESICRIMEYCGASVKRINHIGDWGTQFGMIIAYIKRMKSSDSEYYYDLAKLMEIYRAARILFDSDEIFKHEAHTETVLLQQGLAENIAIWENIRQISLEAFDKIYQQLDITNLEVRGESFYQPHMVQLIQDLQDKLTESYGLKVILATNQAIPFILVKSDGGFTYDTSDLAALRYRIQEEKVDQIIYVIDSSQKQHLDILFQLAQDLGWATANQLKHVGFGLVLGSDGKKIKTRAGLVPEGAGRTLRVSGESAKLQDLLTEAYKHAMTTTTELATFRHQNWTPEEIDTLSKKIAINCIKYTDLSNPRLSNYKFSLNKMLNSKGNTAVYLMYALARCKSILRNIPNCENILIGDLELDTPEARNLAFKLLKYSETIEDSVNQLAPHHICNYLYDLAGLLNKFCEKNRCIDFNPDGLIIGIHEHRVRLINLAINIIRKLFYLVGFEEIEQI